MTLSCAQVRGKRFCEHGRQIFIVLQILQGDVLSTLAQIPDASVRCVCTSPPYFGLRSYLKPDDPKKRFEIGSERTPGEYVAKMVDVFAAVRRVMTEDGTLWLNLGDSYAGSHVCSTNKDNGASRGSNRSRLANGRGDQPAILRKKADFGTPGATLAHAGFKRKDMMMMPQRVAMALQDDGWFLRSQIPWLKRNVMPESVSDRPITATEYIFLLTKRADYYYDRAAVMVAASKNTNARQSTQAEHDTIASRKARAHAGQKSFPADRRNGIRKNETTGDRGYVGFNDRWDVKEREAKSALTEPGNGIKNNSSMATALACRVPSRNRRNSDWLIESWQGLLADDDGDPLAFIVNPQGYKGAHFATWPERLVRPMILAGSAPTDTVLDPFGGSGTTGKVALELGRKAILCELNSEYIPLIRQRCETTLGLGL